MTCPYIYLCTQYEVLHTTTCLRAIHALNHTKNCSRQVVNCDKGDTWSSKHKYFRKNRQRTCPNPSTITSEEGEIRLEIYTNTNILNTVMSFTPYSVAGEHSRAALLGVLPGRILSRGGARAGGGGGQIPARARADAHPSQTATRCPSLKEPLLSSGPSPGIGGPCAKYKMWPLNIKKYLI
jgi:hypothetical protein